VKSRAIRLTCTYLALLAALAGFRYATRDTYTSLRDLREQESSLRYRLASLRLDVQRLESKSRVKEWAARNDFVVFTHVKPDFAPLGALPDAKLDRPERGLEVSTKWR